MSRLLKYGLFESSIIGKIERELNSRKALNEEDVNAPILLPSNILTKANLKKEDLSLIVSTGYGRVSITYADESVTEISCHGKGAHYFNPKIRTILDIGGQDSKAISLNENTQSFIGGLKVW